MIPFLRSWFNVLYYIVLYPRSFRKSGLRSFKTTRRAIRRRDGVWLQKFNSTKIYHKQKVRIKYTKHLQKREKQVEKMKFT